MQRAFARLDQVADFQTIRKSGGLVRVRQESQIGESSSVEMAPDIRQHDRWVQYAKPENGNFNTSRSGLPPRAWRQRWAASPTGL